METVAQRANGARVIPAHEAQGFFTIEQDGRVRFHPDDSARPILIGRLRPIEANFDALVLNHRRAKWNPRSFTFAVPKELFEALGSIQTVATHLMDEQRVFCVDRATIWTCGHWDHRFHNGQAYLFVHHSEWLEVEDLEAIFTFHQDKGAYRAQKGTR